MPTRHKRDILYSRAHADISVEMSKLKEKYELTDVEWLKILTSNIESTLKYMLRFERHGSYDKPAGLE